VRRCRSPDSATSRPASAPRAWGRNPKTGGTIQIKASIAPAFRAGKQLKMALNNKR